VQVDHIKPTLKVPGNKRLKLDCHEPLSNVAFDVNLRRYTMEAAAVAHLRFFSGAGGGGGGSAEGGAVREGRVPGYWARRQGRGGGRGGNQAQSYDEGGRGYGGRGGPGGRAQADPNGNSAFKPYELTMMFWALTKFGDEPCSELRGLFEAQCGRQLHLLKPQELTNVATAYGRLGRSVPLLAAVVDVGPARHCPPRHIMLQVYNTVHEGSKCVG
jgi:hypothetical protein